MNHSSEKSNLMLQQYLMEIMIFFPISYNVYLSKSMKASNNNLFNNKFNKNTIFFALRNTCNGYEIFYVTQVSYYSVIINIYLYKICYRVFDSVH